MFGDEWIGNGGIGRDGRKKVPRRNLMLIVSATGYDLGRLLSMVIVA